jgi:hypothetical protein
MIRRFAVVGGASLMALSALFTAVPALAYQAAPGNSTAKTSSSTAPPGGTITFTANFKDAQGSAVAGASVTFSQQSGPAGCTATFTPTSTTTDANGNASSSVKLPANCPGNYVLAAATAGATVTATVTETGGFPNTVAAGPEAPEKGELPTGLLIGIVGVALVGAGGFFFLRQRRQSNV